MDEFENFETKSFVGRLLGKGDWTGFMDKIKVGHKRISTVKPLSYNTVKSLSCQYCEATTISILLSH